MKKTIALVASALICSVAVSQTLPTKSETDDARDSSKAFMEALLKYKTHEDPTPFCDELERTAKQYVGKSKIQLAMLDRDRDFAVVSHEWKTKGRNLFVKLDEAAAQAIHFLQAYRKAKAYLHSDDDDDEQLSAYVNQAEVERLKFDAVLRETGVAMTEFAAVGKKEGDP
jgi:hypothetical protein